MPPVTVRDDVPGLRRTSGKLEAASVSLRGSRRQEGERHPQAPDEVVRQPAKEDVDALVAYMLSLKK
jgi:hypothetical protein